MTKLLKHALRICALAIGLQATAAQAVYTIATDLASFVAVAGPQTEQFFDGIAPAGGSTFATSMTFGNTTYTAGPTGVTVNLTSASFYAPGTYSHDVLLNSYEPNISGARTLTFTFAAPVTAFAFTYGTFNGSPITFKSDDGNTLTLSPSPSFGHLDFFGITSDTAFSTFSLSVPFGGPTDNETWVIGSYFAPTQTNPPTNGAPEPGSLALLGVALFTVGALRRRKH
jgi:hypothetical protein